MPLRPPTQLPGHKQRAVADFSGCMGGARWQRARRLNDRASWGRLASRALASHFQDALLMGVIRFRLSRPECLPADATERAYVAGIDEIPWLTRTLRVEGGMEVH